jgi:AcrR family transcriptional regulator
MVGSVQVEPRPRRRRRRKDSEREILEAAERLLRERPFRELTVDDLMAATSQSRTAFYRHFTDRQDLLVHLIRDLNEELWEMSAGWLRGSGDPLVEGRRSLERLADLYATHGPLLRAIAEAASHDADVEAVYRGLVQGFVDATAARIRRDAAAGRTSLAHPDHVAAALVWMTERHLAATFGRVGATDADRSAALETLFTVWMRTLYGPTRRRRPGVRGARAWAPGELRPGVQVTIDGDRLVAAAVLERIWAALVPGGTFVMVEPGASSNLEDNLANPMAPMLYTTSTLHCMTVSLAEGGAGLGAAWGEQRARAMLAEAGFADVAVHEAPGDPLNAVFVASRPGA